MSEPKTSDVPVLKVGGPSGTPPAPASPLGWLGALIGQRCPRCHQGHMFRDGLTMNDPCPVCGLIFQREEGYFLGAMYTSYALSVALLGSFYLAATLLLPTLGSFAVAVVALVPFLPLIPAVFRYSRVLWVYLDRASDTGDSSAGAYEKARRHEIAARRAGPPAEGHPGGRET